MGQEIGHQAVHQEHEIFSLCLLSNLGGRGLGSEPTMGYGKRHNTGNIPLSCHLTPNDKVQGTRSLPRLYLVTRNSGYNIA